MSSDLKVRGQRRHKRHVAVRWKFQQIEAVPGSTPSLFHQHIAGVFSGSNGGSQMALSMYGDVDIRAFKQSPHFVERLLLYNQVGLACIWMIAKTLSLCKEGVPPCS